MADIVPHSRALAAYLANLGHFLTPPVTVYTLKRRVHLLFDCLEKAVLNLFREFASLTY